MNAGGIIWFAVFQSGVYTMPAKNSIIAVSEADVVLAEMGTVLAISFLHVVSPQI